MCVKNFFLPVIYWTPLNKQPQMVDTLYNGQLRQYQAHLLQVFIEIAHCSWYTQTKSLHSQPSQLKISLSAAG